MKHRSPTDLQADNEQLELLRHDRACFLLAVVLYPMWYFVCAWFVPNVQDSFTGRGSVGLLFAVGYALSYLPWFRRRVREMLVLLSCVLAAQYVWLMWANHFDLTYIIGLFIVEAAMNALFNDSWSGLVFTYFLTVATLISLGGAPKSFPSAVVLCGVVTIFIVQFVLLKIHLSVVKQLRILERKFRTMADNAPVMIWVATPEGRTTFLNRAWLEFHATSEGEGSFWYDNVHSDEREKCVAQFESCIANKKGMEIELRMRRHDANYRWVFLRTVPMFSDQGILLGFVGTCLDLTEQHELAAERERVRAQMVASANLSALGEMAGGIAHEVNNPLAIILGHADYLTELLSADSFSKKTETMQALQTITSTGWRIEKIVRGLRTLARDASDDPVEITCLRAVIDDTLSICAEKFRNRGVELSVKGDTDARVACRATQLSQVILNLLNNALDAVEGRESKKVSVSIQMRERNVELRISDTGPGISPALRDKIFQPFFTTKDVGKGTGLGLSISRRIIESHHGVLELDVEAPETVFVIRLPLAPDEAQAPGPLHMAA